MDPTTFPVAVTLPTADHYLIFKMAGFDDTGVVRPATGTITVSDPTSGYCAKDGFGNTFFVPKNFPTIPGHDVTVKIVIDCTNESGGALHAEIDVTCQAPPLPPVATHLDFVSGPTVTNNPTTLPPDPGTGTIDF